MTMTILSITLALISMYCGFNLSVSLGLSSVITLIIFRPVPLIAIYFTMVKGVEAYILSAVPLFMLAAYIMANGGIAKRLINFCNALVGWITGGLGHVNIVASLIFGGISGSSVADTAVFGTMLVPQMVRKNYPKSYACAITLTSSVLSVVVPPSILIVILGATVNQSISRLLVGGIIPGTIVALLLCISNFILSKKGGYGRICNFSLKRLGFEFKKSIAAMIAPLILLSGLLSGYTTPTECSVVAVIYSLIVTVFFYREYNLRDFVRSLVETANVNGEILFILSSCRIFTWILSWEGISNEIVSILTSLTDSAPLIYIIIIGVLIIVGMFVDSIIAIFIFGPLFYPVILNFGVDPIHFGIIMIMTLALGLTTPPFGACLFSICRVTKISVKAVVVDSVPFYLSLLLAILICLFIPETVTFLPNLFFD